MDFTSNVSKGYSTFALDGDPRTEDWFLVRSPLPTIAIVLFYLYFAKSLGPRLMEKRQAFNLRTPIMLFNIFIVICNAYIFLQLGKLAWFRKEKYGCTPVDYSRNPEALQMANTLWLLWMLKFLELGDTIFFVLRKKFNQVSGLHLYHHALVSTFGWIVMRFIPGGYASFMCFINCFVHVVMYTYYGLTALGPQVQKYLWWKKYITRLQLYQFVIITLYYFQMIFQENCEINRALVSVMIFLTCVFFLLFSKFYIYTYMETKKAKLSGLKQNGASCHSKMEVNGEIKNGNLANSEIRQRH